MAPEIERITNTFLSAPARIEVARQASASETIEQGVVMFKASRRDREGSEKRALLRKMIDNEGDKCSNAIVFCNRKTDVDIVAKSLKKHGYDAAPIHGDLDQSQRTRTLDGFREGSLRFLIASDVAARGLDVPAVSHVFNFDVPSHAEDYVHRIGRTGRAGRDGKAMMICSPRDEKNFDAIERLLQTAIPRLENPLGSVTEEVADDTPEAAPKDAKARRTRGGRGRSKPSDAPKADAPKVEAVAENKLQEQPREAEKPRQQARRETEQPHRQAREPEQPRQQQARSDSPRNNNHRDRRNDRGGRDNNVVGMGDHMPSFIAMSFDERRAS
jgi:ATP-dependent RNA helicase RhlE